MNKKKLSLLLGAGIIVAGIFIAMAPQGDKGNMQQAQPNEAPRQEQQFGQVVAAKRDIPKGTLLTEDAIKAKKVPMQAIGPDDLTSPEQAIGKVSTTDIVVGETITKTKTMVRASEMKLSMKVPDGKRAVTISIDQLASLENMVKPSDKVDVIGTFVLQPKTPPIVVPMFEDVLILAVGKSMATYAQAPEYKSITMALTSKESTLLLYATQLGKLNLLLRSPLDSSTSRVKEAITIDKLWQTLLNVGMQQQTAEPEPKQAVQQAPAPAPEAEVEVYSGGTTAGSQRKK